MAKILNILINMFYYSGMNNVAEQTKIKKTKRGQNNIYWKTKTILSFCKRKIHSFFAIEPFLIHKILLWKIIKELQNTFFLFHYTFFPFFLFYKADLFFLANYESPSSWFWQAQSRAHITILKRLPVAPVQVSSTNSVNPANLLISCYVMYYLGCIIVNYLLTFMDVNSNRNLH